MRHLYTSGIILSKSQIPLLLVNKQKTFLQPPFSTSTLTGTKEVRSIPKASVNFFEEKKNVISYNDRQTMKILRKKS